VVLSRAAVPQLLFSNHSNALNGVSRVQSSSSSSSKDMQQHCACRNTEQQERPACSRSSTASGLHMHRPHALTTSYSKQRLKQQLSAYSLYESLRHRTKAHSSTHQRTHAQACERAVQNTQQQQPQ
jgi:hypothetical protein